MPAHTGCDTGKSDAGGSKIGRRIVHRLLTVCLLPALLFSLSACDYGRMKETPGVKPHEEPLAVMESGTVPVSGGELQYRIAPPESLVSPGNPEDAAWIAAGTQSYERFCQQCHGRNLDGRGTVGQSFMPLPTNLKSAKVQDMNDGQLFQVISYSRPESRHPALATTISVENRWQVIGFLRTEAASP